MQHCFYLGCPLAWYIHICFRFDLEDFKYNQVNMTAFRIVDGDNIKVKTVLNEMENLPEIGYKILNKTQVDT